ncbi:MAG: ATP-binding protein [Burkholderiaceae bacterium]
MDGRETTRPTPDKFILGRFEIRITERLLLEDGQPCPIGTRAFDVLRVLIENYGLVVSRTALIDAAWTGLIVEENNLSVQISTLRKLLGPETIKTIPGRGYQLVAPVGAEGVESNPDSPSVEPAPESAPRLSNLPARLPVLYGREQELIDLGDQLDRRSLVTITGPSGIGKTRLAQAIADDLQPRFPDGVWMVELDSIEQAEQLAGSIAQALQISLPADRPALPALSQALRPRRLLLVLDNCEHLIEAVRPVIHALLHEAPEIKILATSQTVLRIPEEQLFRLEPLALPGLNAIDHATPTGAVRLFVERVRELDSNFVLTTDKAAATAAICQQLDGIPLALELAAARVPMYGLERLLARINDSLRIFNNGMQLTPRHQTLRAALDWSHDLLSDDEQRVFRRLSVFVGGFTLEAMQAVVMDDSLDEWEAADHLSSLIDKSLVSIQQTEPPRYRLLETSRNYANEKLELAAETAQTRRRHASATLAALRQAIKARDTESSVREMNNTRRAYLWAVGPDGDDEMAIELVCASGMILAVEGFVAEALARHLKVKPLLKPSTPQPLQAQYWQWLGRLGSDGRLPVKQCIEAFDRAALIFETLGNRRHQHACLRQKAQALLEIQAFDLASEALARAAEMEAHRLPVADKIRRLRVQGMLEDRSGDYARSLSTWEQAYELAESSGVSRYSLILLNDIAGAHLILGNANEASSRYHDLAARARGTRGAGLTLSHALAGLTAALIFEHQLPAARQTATEAIPHLQRSSLFFARGDVFALLLAHENRLSDAARLIGAADEARRRSASSRNSLEQTIRNAAMTLIGAADNSAQTQTWIDEGSFMSEDDLTELILRTPRGHTETPG